MVSRGGGQLRAVGHCLEPHPASGANGQGWVEGDFAAEHAGGLAGELEVPVAGEGLAIDIEGDEGALGGEFVGGRGHFKHRGAFINFVEHGGVDHGGAGGDGVEGLAPVESAVLAGDLVVGAAGEGWVVEATFQQSERRL